MILHPYPEQEIYVKEGQYAGATGRVVRILDGYGVNGFVELAFDKRKGETMPKNDLVPVAYLDLVNTNRRTREPKGEPAKPSVAATLF